MRHNSLHASASCVINVWIGIRHFSTTVNKNAETIVSKFCTSYYSGIVDLCTNVATICSRGTSRRMQEV